MDADGRREFDLKAFLIRVHQRPSAVEHSVIWAGV
jgi:hypothetical protein